MPHDKQNTIFLGFADMSCLWNNTKTHYPTYAEIELRYTKQGPVLSICAYIYNRNHTRMIYGGQCLDEIATTNIKNNAIFQEIYDLWKKYHLNDMHAGTPTQEKILHEGIISGQLPKQATYEQCVDYLKKEKVYVDPSVKDANGNAYRYGYGWLYEPIPDEALTRIEKLLNYTQA